MSDDFPHIHLGKQYGHADDSTCAQCELGPTAGVSYVRCDDGRVLCCACADGRPYWGHSVYRAAPEQKRAAVLARADQLLTGP
ncbi:hypothetical protein ACIQ8G_03720 [Streptomyces sp. NPDC094154]|uniref:hypothetical protein n=1 Tax=Streptomyces sp. NPDC094154 TaxID=3366059 RepID=UPI0037F23835